MMILNILHGRDEGWEEIYVAMHAHNQEEGIDIFEVWWWWWSNADKDDFFGDSIQREEGGLSEAMLLLQDNQKYGYLD